MGIGLNIRFEINLEGITFHLRENCVIKNIMIRLQKWSEICVLSIVNVLSICITEVTLTDDSEGQEVGCKFKSGSTSVGLLSHICGLFSHASRVFTDEGWLRF